MELKLMSAPERVRKFAEILFGSRDQDGVKRALDPVFWIFYREAALGFCSFIDIHQNGARIILEGNDRGMRLDQVHEDLRKIGFFCTIPGDERSRCGHDEFQMDLFEKFHPVAFGDSDPPARSTTYMDIFLFQCACENLALYARRDGMEYSIRFHRGEEQQVIREPAEGHGTQLEFELDPEVFLDTVVPEDYFCDIFRNWVSKIPTLTCAYTGENGRTELFGI